ncbi:Rox3p [Ascoidea rubescens DSM 1968]|uniref:Mediator of RNA polymerase II transcription subunit 19 n=1 Tax=Ascoidea rubescens DSM 1968 TaxID=1344418 RepID=A0A1D2VM59_9ASCO|nr:Rox3-domain-containing protein [Ascoidea rubescens DSM 1968]ODV62700.1 Rox3-domain-containing protein [Ascoidea rubescens DSM 1968]
MPSDESSDIGLYYVDFNRNFQKCNACPLDNLIESFGLSDIAASVARTKPNGEKAVKLRKSYKSHINDLPYKHTIKSDNILESIALREDITLGLNDLSNFIKPIDRDLVSRALNFKKTPKDSLNDIEIEDLQFKTIVDFDKKSLKRKQKNGYTNDDDLKRRRM